VAALSEQERIREDYEGYASAGRDRLWDLTNPGFARLSRDRDRALLDLTLKSLPQSGGTVLDVGCGDGGHLAAALSSRRDVNAYGIDLLEDRIERARERVPKATFTVGSADDLPYDLDAFDVVTTITLFSSLRTQAMEERVAHEIGRVIKPGGWLIWFDLRYDNPSNPAVHGISGGDLARMFPGWDQELRSSTLLPPIARRLGRTTSALYPLLHSIPPLRSHLIGRLRCPT
jgi:ubiquinone/menaquinone biosynthesis C-methylase UbiE